MDGSTEADQQSMILLLTEYEKLMSIRYRKVSLLYYLLNLLIAPENLYPKISNLVIKIGLLLEFTDDLFRNTAFGTALDPIILYNGDSEDFTSKSVRRWLEILIINGVNLRAYGEWEQRQHPAGLVNPWYFGGCCRIIHVEFIFGESDDDLTIKVRNEIDPKFSHIDSAYMCEAGRRREVCLSQIDDAYIRDGRPLPSVPGSWHERLKPNSELTLVHRDFLGWMYVNQVQEDDYLWADGLKAVWDDMEESDEFEESYESEEVDDSEDSDDSREREL